MRPDLPWNVAGIPSEAREAARAAARREGLSIGEWLTRRILAGLSGLSEEPQREDWSSYRPDDHRMASTRRDSDDMLDRVSRSESETADVYRRIEEQLRSMGRRLDSSERSQSESNRVMSKAAVEMNITAREQAQAFDQLGSHVVGLSDRIERVERSATTDGLRDAVKALHQGLSRLADQITQTANQSATQISALAGNIENVAGRLGQARQDFHAATQALEGRVVQLGERIQTVEKAAHANAVSLERALEALETRQAARKDDANAAIARLEENVSRLEARNTDPAIDRRLSGIERTLGDIVGRIDHEEQPAETAEMALKKLAQRFDALESSQREALAELRKAAAPRLAPDPVYSLGDSLPFPPETAPFPPQTAPFPAPGGPFGAAATAFTGQGAPFTPLPEAPPFVEQPPFADQAPPPAYDTAAAFGGEQQFAAGQSNGADAYTPAPTVDSYLNAARRSARAAATAEAERSATLGGFAWGSTGASAKPGSKSNRTRVLLIAVLALAAIAAIAASVMNHRSTNDTSNSVLGALFEKKAAPAPLKSAPEALSTDQNYPPPSSASQQTPASQPAKPPLLKQNVKPAPVRPVPAAAPGSPQLPQKLSAVPQRQIATASQPSGIQPSGPPPAVPARQTPAVPALDRVTTLANAGNSRAELIVGLKYLDSEGALANDKEAAKWLSRAAQAGEPVAQYRLGAMYEHGKGVPADAAQALRWYLAAANQGNRKAMHNLAVAYAEGNGTKKDFTEASRWFSRAANLGLADSQFNLAVLYERGYGVPQSLIDAYKWYAVAAAQGGDTEAKARMDAISTQLSAEARGAAQHAADIFKPGPLDPKANVAPTITDLTRG
ncbi:MAG: hypothetical protein WCA81_07925 [Rhizomicrobium sp.]